MFFKKSFFLLSFLALSLSAIYLLSVIFAPNTLISAEKTPSKTFSALSVTETPFYSSKNDQSSELPAAAPGKAKGKITERTIGSEGANLKYGKIYIKNNTSQKPDLKSELLAGVGFKLSAGDLPQVLIVHTHTTECYMEEKRNYYTETDKTRTTDNSKNMVAVGEVLKNKLKEKGIVAIHATEKHDYPEYTGSYGRAEATINKYLKKYPTIKVVIDLHRDSVSDGKNTKSALTAKINGKSAAQLMIVAGCGAGEVENFKNWRENFRLAIRLQQSMEVMYPSLARPILFTERRYNQHLTKGSLLIECGTEANTLAEAKYSAELLANALAITLKNL